MTDRLSALLSRDNGQTMAEYAIILAVVAVVAAGAYVILGGKIMGAINDTNNKLPTSTTTTTG